MVSVIPNQATKDNAYDQLTTGTEKSVTITDESSDGTPLSEQRNYL